MKNLNPTLWRTCRMLAGTTRIRLLRELHTHPGQSVSELARAVGIKNRMPARNCGASNPAACYARAVTAPRSSTGWNRTRKWCQLRRFYGL